MNEMNDILIFLVVFLAGGIIGSIIYHLTMGRKKTDVQQQELDQTKAELEHYKSQVNDHFNTSADLMKQVASSYQALYTHMAGQSQTLLSDSENSPFARLTTPDNNDQFDNEVVADSCETTSDKPTAIADDCETILDKSAAIADDCETIIDKSAAVADDCETILDKSAAVADDCETILDKPENVTDCSEGELTKQTTK